MEPVPSPTIYIPDFEPFNSVTHLTVYQQIEALNHQYMEKLLFISVILFIYVLYNNLFRFRSQSAYDFGKRFFDPFCIVISAFAFVISLIYFTGWDL